ncbi:MAG: hypothetical protein ICV87_05630, partial [Gemmatimonadetes bacterium]|nr:hypothetical protein [Gemmatimonadota bacterium]
MTETNTASRPATDRVYGIIAAALVLLALFFLFRGGPSDTGVAPAAGVPPLSIVEPREGAEVSLPAGVVFDAGTRLEVGPMGWNAGGRHVHLLVGGTELMAGAAEVQPLGGNRYRWTVPSLPQGAQTLRLTWSDEAHRPLAEG